MEYRIAMHPDDVLLVRHVWVGDAALDVYFCTCHGYVVGYEEVRSMIAQVTEAWPMARMWTIDDFLDRVAHGRVKFNS